MFGLRNQFNPRVTSCANQIASRRDASKVKALARIRLIFAGNEVQNFRVPAGKKCGTVVRRYCAGGHRSRGIGYARRPGGENGFARPGGSVETVDSDAAVIPACPLSVSIPRGVRPECRRRRFMGSRRRAKRIYLNGLDIIGNSARAHQVKNIEGSLENMGKVPAAPNSDQYNGFFLLGPCHANFACDAPFVVAREPRDEQQDLGWPVLSTDRHTG